MELSLNELELDTSLEELDVLVWLELAGMSLLGLDDTLEDIKELETEEDFDELELLLSPPQAVSSPTTDTTMINEIGFMTNSLQKNEEASLCATDDKFMKI